MTLEELVTQYTNHVQTAKDSYAQADEALASILRITGGATKRELADGSQLVIKDRFADGTLKAFHATACNRYEVKVEPTREAAGPSKTGQA